MPQSDKHEFNPDDPIDPTAARLLYAKQDMLYAQYRVIQPLVLRIYEIAEREAFFERSLGASQTTRAEGSAFAPINSYTVHQNTRRPSQVYLIDGARGAGKTSLLITLRWLIESMGRPEIEIQGRDDPEKLLTDIADDLRRRGSAYKDIEIHRDSKFEIQNLKLETLNFKMPHIAYSKAPRKTALCLAVIHPADLDDRQPILEGIFALISDKLKVEIELAKAAGPSSHSRRELLEQLEKEIIEKVARGWHLSRQAGVDAILRDSVDYQDYLNQIGRSNQESFNRVQIWRDYVNRFLDAMNAELLVILLDDADNKPDVTLDILNTARIFLDHPRIVTLLAGNLRSMRQSLVMDEFSQLSAAIESLRRAPEATEQDLRRLARRHTEEFIEKVLPRPNRFFVDLDATEQPLGDAADTEGKPIASGHIRLLGSTFDVFCERMLDIHRANFLRTKYTAHRRYMESKNEIQTDKDRLHLEHFMSWWLLRFWYADWLTPRSARHLLAMRAFTTTNRYSPAITDQLPDFHNKRLAVILFESPENFGLIHRFGDYDGDILSWLRRQRIASHWHGDRFFEINGVKHFSDSYGYRILQYRIDLGIGLPVRENPTDTVPRGMLPHPAGPNLISQPPFFPRIRPPRPTGVAAQIKHSLVPANCYFMFGLQALSDICWEDRTEADTENKSPFWGHRLILEWPQYFHFEDATRGGGSHGSSVRQENKATKENEVRGQDGAGNNAVDPQEDARREESIRRYFVDIVIPLGSINIGQYVHADDEMRRRPETMEDCKRRALLTSELREKIDEKGVPSVDGECFARSFSTMVAQEARRMEYYRALSEDRTTKFFTDHGRSDGNSRVAKWDEIVMGFLPNDPKKAGIHRRIPYYRALINDVRCAWSAARIFLAEIDGPLIKLSEVEVEDDRTSDSEKDMAVSRTRRGKFTGFSKYQMITLSSIRRWQGRGKYGSGLYKILVEWHKEPVFLCIAKGEGEKDKIVEKNGVKAAILTNSQDGLVGSAVNVSNQYVRSELARILWRRKEEEAARKILRGEKDWWSASATRALLKARRDDGGEWGMLLDPSVARADEMKRHKARIEVARRGREGRSRPDTADQNDVQEQDSRATKEAMKGRVARSYASFLYALAPCLPTAIHLDIAGTVYHHLSDEFGSKDGMHKKDEDELCKIVGQWESAILEFIYFMMKYRALLEIDHLRQCEFENIDRLRSGSSREESTNSKLRNEFPTRASAGIHLALAPDYCSSTLGIGEGFGRKAENEGFRISESGAEELVTTLDNLFECLNFLRAIKSIALRKP